MKKPKLMVTHKDGRTFYTSVFKAGINSDGQPTRILTVTVDRLDSGYIKLHNAVQQMEGASWSYNGEFDYDIERFEKDNPYILRNMAKAIREKEK